MQKQESFFHVLNDKIRNSISIRLAVIGFLILILLLPVSMVQNLILERKARQESTVYEVSNKWARRQKITGLCLSVPYTTQERVYINEVDKIVQQTKYVHLLPTELNIKGAIAPQMRYRGIYEVVVYNTKLEMSGYFSDIGFDEKRINGEIDWEHAFISLGISDLRGIQEQVYLDWKDSLLSFQPGIETNDILKQGMSIRIPLPSAEARQGKHSFSLSLNLNGSSSLSFSPVGRETNIQLNSSWKDPKFDGAFLPDSSQIKDDGFFARWKILHLNLPYPRKFAGEMPDIANTTADVALFMPSNHYQQSTRSAKYAVLFIALTFIIFFFVHIINKVSIHPVQYILIGLALCIFYLLLISLSEHIGFAWAYLCSSIAVIGLITFYAGSMFKKARITRMIFILLSVLYGFIYTIIQLDHFSLLVGSLGLFFALSLGMYLSRNIDWYNIKTRKTT